LATWRNHRSKTAVQDTEPIPAVERAAEVAAWLRLAQVPGVGRLSAGRLLEAFGAPQQIFNAGYAALLEHVSPTQARALCAPMTAEATRLLDTTLSWLAQPFNQVLTLHDAAYPHALANIADPPLLLYIKGHVDLLAGPALAIVGSRNASTQGRANAHAFAQALSEAGLTIVSGLALGIDAAAHEGALRATGSTVAVVGTGVDRIYPATNGDLARRIAAQGCIVSEFPLGTAAAKGNFPQRNRIISGLSAGVLVVEAAAQSGSLITARLAGEQGREVFAIPGSIHSSLSKGCHQLIRDGVRLVETADEVLEAMRVSPLAGRRTMASAGPAGGEGLLATLGHDPIELDALLALTGADAGQLSSQLLVLELAGMVERLPGGKVQRVCR
jgi:DNA processing protein